MPHAGNAPAALFLGAGGADKQLAGSFGRTHIRDVGEMGAGACRRLRQMETNECIWTGEQFQFAADVPAHRVGAFFDIDQTLVRGASAYWAAKEMVRRSLVEARHLVRVTGHAFMYFLFGEASGDKVAGLIDQAATLTAGIDVAELEHMAEDVYENFVVPRLYRPTYERIREHNEAGHVVYLVSATPWFIAEAIAKAVGAAGGIGTRTKIVDGLLAGKLDGSMVHGQEKAVQIRRIAAETNLDLAESWAYSDSANDMPMLSEVGHPVAVNPDRALAQFAHTRGWPIVVAGTRKDMMKRAVGLVGLAVAASGVAFVACGGVQSVASRLGRGFRRDQT